MARPFPERVRLLGHVVVTITMALLMTSEPMGLKLRAHIPRNTKTGKQGFDRPPYVAELKRLAPPALTISAASFVTPADPAHRGTGRTPFDSMNARAPTADRRTEDIRRDTECRFPTGRAMKTDRQMGTAADDRRDDWSPPPATAFRRQVFRTLGDAKR